VSVQVPPRRYRPPSPLLRVSIYEHSNALQAFVTRHTFLDSFSEREPLPCLGTIRELAHGSCPSSAQMRWPVAVELVDLLRFLLHTFVPEGVQEELALARVRRGIALVDESQVRPGELRGHRLLWCRESTYSPKRSNVTKSAQLSCREPATLLFPWLFMCFLVQKVKRPLQKDSSLLRYFLPPSHVDPSLPLLFSFFSPCISDLEARPSLFS
jgi:hypothetical protein